MGFYELFTKTRELIELKREYYYRKVRSNILSSIFILLGFILLMIAAVFFFVEYTDLTRTISLAIVGGILIIIALLTKFITGGE